MNKKTKQRKRKKNHQSHLKNLLITISKRGDNKLLRHRELFGQAVDKLRMFLKNNQKFNKQRKFRSQLKRIYFKNLSNLKMKDIITQQKKIQTNNKMLKLRLTRLKV